MNSNATPRKNYALWIMASTVFLLYIQLMAGSVSFLGGIILNTYWENKEILNAISMFGSAVINIRESLAAITDELNIVSNPNQTNSSQIVSWTLDDYTDSLEDSFDALGKKMFDHKGDKITLLSKELSKIVLVFSDSSTNLNYSLSFMSSVQMIDMSSRTMSRVSKELSGMSSQSESNDKRRTIIDSALFILTNSVRGVLPLTLSLLQGIRQWIVQDEIETFNWYKIFFYAWYFSSLCICIFIYFWWQLKCNRLMYGIVDNFSLLTIQECKLHIQDIEKIERLFIDKKYSETDLLAKALVKDKGYLEELKGRESDVRTHRVKPLFKNQLHRTFIVSLACLTFSTVYFNIVGYFLISASSQITFVFNLQKMYLDHCSTLIGLNNRYNYFNSVLLYGGYYDINGNIVEGDQFKNSVKIFSDFWMNHATDNKLIFGTYYQIVESLLYDDVCSMFITETNLDKYRKYACDTSLGKGSAQGLIYFLINYDEYMSSLCNLRIEELSKNPTTANKTSQFNAKLDVWFRDDIVRLNVAFTSATSVFFKNIESKLNLVAEQFIVYLGQILIVFLTVVSVSFVLIKTITGLLIYWFSERDWAICYQTFKIISPSIIATNAYILSAYKRLFLLDR